MKATIKLYRYIFNTEGDRNIIGDLFLNDETTPTCYTLEDELRPEDVKVYGQTAIPAGTYKVVLDYSPHFKRITPHILDVPNFEGIRIHGGNTSKDTLGCVLVAYNTDKKRIWGTAEADLTEELSKYDEIEITIENRPFTYRHK
jgi:hypothetical protein